MESPRAICQCCPWLQKLHRDTRSCICFFPTHEHFHCKCCKFYMMWDTIHTPEEDMIALEKYDNYSCWSPELNGKFMHSAPALNGKLEAALLATRQSNAIHPVIVTDVFSLLGQNFYKEEKHCAQPRYLRYITCTCRARLYQDYHDSSSGSETEDESTFPHKRIRLE